MMMQSTDLSESQKERRRFNIKPSLNEVKGHGASSAKTSSFTTSTKARVWDHQNADLSSLFILPEGARAARQAGQQPGGVGQVSAGVGQPAVPTPQPQQQPQAQIQMPAW